MNKKIPQKNNFVRLISVVGSLGISLFFSNVAEAKNCTPTEIKELQQALSQEELTQESSDFLEETMQCSEAVRSSIDVLTISQQSSTRRNAAYALSLAKPDDIDNVLNELLSLLETERDSRVRYWLITVFGNAQAPLLKRVTALIKILEDDPVGENRGVAAWAIGQLRAYPEQALPALMLALQRNHPSEQDDVYILAVEAIASFADEVAAMDIGKRDVYLTTLETLVQSTDPKYSPEVKLEIAHTLKVIAQAVSEDAKKINIQEISRSFDRLYQALQELEDILNALKAANLVSTDSYKDIKGYKDQLGFLITLITGKQWFSKSSVLIVGHGIFWLLLVVAYPRSPMVQAIFFWNPWIRKIAGFPYVTEVLKWNPYFRQILFIPFQEVLRSDANLDLLNTQTYFADLTVKAEGWTESQPISKVIPKLQGQIVLQGESGSGKSMFLRYLLKQSSRISVYLPAQTCEQGVIAAIQTKLYGQAQDADFLRDLIYSGAIDIYIDGLNEATPDTRASIKAFVERNFKGNIILTTQPLEEKPPGKIYTLQPLDMGQISTFLQQHRPISSDAQPEPELGQLTTYTQVCTNYLQSVQADLNSNTIPAGEKATLQQVLSNPMDLTVVAQLLANRQQPNLLRLREQQYTTMSEDYKQIHLGKSFPLIEFAEMAYQIRLKSQSQIPDADFLDELLCLERHKMVVRRPQPVDTGKNLTHWFFRHEKIADFFIARSFLHAKDDRQTQHFSDSRFWGVYLLLATLLPEPQKMALREQLIQYAAKHNDHSLSDAFIRLVASSQLTDPSNAS